MIYIPKDSPFAAQFCERWTVEESKRHYDLAEPRPDNWRDAAVEASQILGIYAMCGPNSTQAKHENNQWKVDDDIAVLERYGYTL